MRRSRPAALAALTLFVAAACGVRDRRGGADTATVLALDEPELVIGQLEGSDALERIPDARVGPDGRIYLVQPIARTVRVFDADGTAAGTIGGQGEGPGEFLLPQRLGFLGDTLWVVDRRQRRISLFTLAGEHLEERPLPSPPPLADGESATFAALMPGGAALFSSFPAFGSPRVGTRHPFPLLARSRPGVVDTLATLDMAHRQMIFIDADASGAPTSVEVFAQPFADVTLWHVAPGSGRIALVDRPAAAGEDSAAYRVTVLRPAGDTLYSTEISYRPQPVDPLVVDSLLTMFRRGGHSDGDVRERLFLPESTPEVSDVIVGGDGRVWVARTRPADQPSAWDVFGPAGELGLRVEAPLSVDLFHADATTAWGIHTDSLDVPYVVRFRLPARME